MTLKNLRTLKNKSFLSGMLCGAICVCLLLLPRLSSADLVKLKNGGELRGKIDWKKSPPQSSTISINTLTGATVVVERKVVEFAIRRPEKIEHYETRARRTLPTVAAQWELAEWCRQQNMKNQRAIHLEKIIELDPEHVKAHVGLGHIKHAGKWTTRDELMTAQGYVKYKNRYITPQELELIQQNEAELQKNANGFSRCVSGLVGCADATSNDSRQVMLN